MLDAKFLKAFFTVSCWTCASRLSGLVREMMLASVFGASVYTDIYLFAIKLPNFFRRFFAEGALNAVLVPKFSTLVERDTKENVQKFATEMFSVLAVGLLVFVLAVEIAMPAVVYIIAPGFRSQPFISSNITYYARFTFPYILLISMVAYMSGILNSLHRFAWAASISIVVNASAVLALCVALLGSFSATIVMHLLCTGIIVGGVAQCVIMMLNCYKHGIPIRLIRPKLTPEIKKVLKAAVPGMVGAGVMQVNIFVDMAFASGLPIGAVSYLGYADRLNQLPLSLIGAALGTTLLPSLSRLWAAGKFEDARITQNKALVFASMFALPAAVGLFLTAEQVVHLLYGRGKFDLIAEHNTVTALRAFVVGLPGYVAMKIFSTVFFANKDTTTPVLIAGGSVILNVVLNAILTKYFAHVGIATATAAAAWANALTGGVILRKRGCLGKLQWASLLRIIVACFVMGVVVAMSDFGIFVNAGIGTLIFATVLWFLW
jgi:putative peptidoglycan lipid II flippase